MNLVCPSCGMNNRVPETRLLDEPHCGSCKSLLLPSEPVALEEASFDRFVKATELPVITDFWADWCGPCKTMAPAFKQAARERPTVHFVKLGTDRAPDTAARYGIRSIPTLVAFRGGREIARISGAMSAQQIVSWIDREFQP